MAKSAKSERQAKIDAIRSSQQSAEKRQGRIIIVIAAVISLGLIAAVAAPIVNRWWDKRQFDNVALGKIGAPASACQDITTEKADGTQQHVPEGTAVTYTTAPPAFGAHWNVAGIAPAPMARKVYTADDRPALEALVHNLEHGYTILWYDETIADDSTEMNAIRAIADRFAGTDNYRFKFIAAPWLPSDEDGKAFPDGQHVALTHWSAGGAGETDTAKQLGVFQYCSQVSGAAVDDFMTQYPYLDSPEPQAM